MPLRLVKFMLSHQCYLLQKFSPNALFLATAMEEKAEAFITNDVRLQGGENIEIMLLKNFT